MNRKDIEKKTMDYFQSGLCCSAAVFKTLIEIYGQPDNDDIIKIASGFCGGVGGTHEEICGALSGSILAIGYLHGRNHFNGNNQCAKELTAELHKCFREKFGSTQCSVLLKLIGEEALGKNCCELSGETAGMLYELIENN